MNELDAQECRSTLKKVLASETFNGSRRLSEFLSYTANAALEGRTELDQYEIAQNVLGRSADFNPWDDATVRKLGTQLRHKLEEYYAGAGIDDPLVVSLPRRSYIPRFQRRPSEPATTEDAPSNSPAIQQDAPIVPAAAAPSGHWLWLLSGLVAGGAVATLFNLSVPQRTEAFAKREVVIHTSTGDLRGKSYDLRPDAVQIGAEIGEGQEVVARLKFTPEHSAQQAGVMAVVDSDHFVRFGHHFKNRALLEFGLELDGAYQTPISDYSFDPLGQQGLARWLSIRRSGQSYRAFVSNDGFGWQAFGSKLTLSADGRNPSASIYAFNGRTNNPSTPAIFDQFGTAIAFHNREDGPLAGSEFPDWEQKVDCASPVTAEIKQNALQVRFADEAIGCSWSFSGPVGSGDWAFSALVDFEPVSGSSIGIKINGADHDVALSRRDLNGVSLMLERLDDNDSRIPDFPGTPPVVLRFEKTGSVIRAAASRDGERFRDIGEVRIAETGEPQRAGIVAGIAHWTSQIRRPPARIYWIRKESVKPALLLDGNVPR